MSLMSHFPHEQAMNQLLDANKTVQNNDTDTTLKSFDKVADQDNQSYTYLTAWGGYKPYYIGCCLYYHYIMEEVSKAIETFELWSKMYDKKNRTYIKLNLDLTKFTEIVCDNGTVKKYKNDTLHYAPKFKGCGWYDRYWNIWTKMGIHPPFRQAQVDLLQKGYYLVELSDPSMSYKTVFKLYKVKSPTPLNLWHGYDKIPGVV